MVYFNTSAGPPNRETALIGLIGGVSLGLLNAILYLFFVFPIVAHDLFQTYLHYDGNVLGYAAGYVGVLGMLGVPTALLVAHFRVERSADEAEIRRMSLHRSEPN